MKCPLEIGEHAQLLAFGARKPDAPGAAELERHVATCSACRQFVAGQQAVWQALDAWEAPPVAADFDRQLYRRIEQDRLLQETVWWRRWLGPLRPVVLRRGLPIAAAAGVLAAAVLMLDRPAVTPVSKPETVQVENLQPEQVQHALDDMEMLSDFTRAARADAGEL